MEQGDDHTSFIRRSQALLGDRHRRITGYLSSLNPAEQGSCRVFSFRKTTSPREVVFLLSNIFYGSTWLGHVTVAIVMAGLKEEGPEPRVEPNT